MDIGYFLKKEIHKQLKKEKEKAKEVGTILFGDIKTEGKKRGYERAAKEYEKILTDIRNEYIDEKNCLNRNKEYYDRKIESLLRQYDQLKKEQERLRKCLAGKLKGEGEIRLADALKNSYSNGARFRTLERCSIFDLFFDYRKKLFDKEEMKGYIEAKAVYEKKIESMKQELKNLKISGNQKIQELKETENAILDEIVKVKKNIVELKLALESE